MFSQKQTRTREKAIHFFFKALAAAFSADHSPSISAPTNPNLCLSPCALALRAWRATFASSNDRSLHRTTGGCPKAPSGYRATTFYRFATLGSWERKGHCEEASNCVWPWALIQRLQLPRPSPFPFCKAGSKARCCDPHGTLN